MQRIYISIAEYFVKIIDAFRRPRGLIAGKTVSPPLPCRSLQVFRLTGALGWPPENLYLVRLFLFKIFYDREE